MHIGLKLWCRQLKSPAIAGNLYLGLWRGYWLVELHSTIPTGRAWGRCSSSSGGSSALSQSGGKGRPWRQQGMETSPCFCSDLSHLLRGQRRTVLVPLIPSAVFPELWSPFWSPKNLFCLPHHFQCGKIVMDNIIIS